jgi:hypothetical protein
LPAFYEEAAFLKLMALPVQRYAIENLLSRVVQPIERTFVQASSMCGLQTTLNAKGRAA